MLPIDMDRIGPFIQGSALLVTLSVAFGRIFVLARDRTLGFVVSPTQLNALDYAIISPNVAIMSVGISTFVVFYWLWRPPRFDFWRLDVTIYGVVLIAFYIAGVFVDEPTRHSTLDLPGAWGLFKLVQIVSLYLGIALVYESLPQRLTRNYLLGSTTETRNENRRQLLSTLPAITGFYLLMIFLMVLSFVWNEGQRDADRQFRDAPLAFVSYSTDQRRDMLSDYIQQDDMMPVTKRLHKIALVDDGFVYLLEPGDEAATNDSTVLALPIAQIKAIEYITCEEPGGC